MDEFIPQTPVNFFQIALQCQRHDEEFPAHKRFHLPDLTGLNAEPHFARAAIAWSPTGIHFHASVSQPVKHCYFPDVSRGDCVELFFDTRDVKTSGFNTRFCHHFFFLPEAIEGHQAAEITRFRTEDLHELCDPNELKVKVQRKSNGYSMQIFVPSQCLYGYDPDQFNRLGFTYRISRPDGPSQHFSVVTDDFQVEQQPSLWSSLTFMK